MGCAGAFIGGGRAGVRAGGLAVCGAVAVTSERDNDVPRGTDLDELIADVQREHESTLKTKRRPRIKRMAHVSEVLERLGFIDREEG